ncbi:hypothetical protein [Aureispira anguillae]|uniref:Uncharacterized protein n=1 Tax=Aureispira anguillae TaxID=2864201 RepID=A0A916DVY0_9BACT|nr:hypothetical protein [Aureispira anguillae]BDS14065.1 hypothetical protein AsAng_0048300 [Aureispira anguillae]
MVQLLLCFLCVLTGHSYAQDYTFKPLKTISKTTRWMEVDKMKHLYLIEDDHTLSKYSPDGLLLYQFNENSLGQISYVDISNPLRVLVYYDDYATVLFLDRTLSEIQRHDLSILDISQVQALGTASDNTIWIFDNNSYTLKKIDSQNNVLAESTDLNLLLSEEIIPNRLTEVNSRVYLNSPNLGILVFDIFGNYIKTIEIPQLDYFQLYEGQLFYVEKKIFQAYHLLSFQTKKIELPFVKDNLEQISIAQERIYIKYPNKINIIDLKQK